MTYNFTSIEDKSAIAMRFERMAKHYDQFAFVQAEIGNRLLERCQWLKNTPARILNIGSASGRFTRNLQTQYPKAQIIGLDAAFKMCDIASKKNLKKLFKRSPAFICADMERLPFASNSFDLIISNCTFEWSRALPQLFLELKRILNEKGTILFTTLGPDSLQELANSSYQVDGLYHVNAFLDMHHIGDILLKTGLTDPVMDKETLTITYDSVKSLLLDLRKSGSSYIFKANTLDNTLNNTASEMYQSKKFQGKAWLEKLIQNYNNFKLANQHYPVTIEIIYGYACKYHHVTGQTERKIPTDIAII